MQGLWQIRYFGIYLRLNPLNTELNPICQYYK